LEYTQFRIFEKTSVPVIAGRVTKVGHRIYINTEMIPAIIIIRLKLLAKFLFPFRFMKIIVYTQNINPKRYGTTKTGTNGIILSNGISKFTPPEMSLLTGTYRNIEAIVIRI
jgi:hypothetical protein